MIMIKVYIIGIRTRINTSNWCWWNTLRLCRNVYNKYMDGRRKRDNKISPIFWWWFIASVTNMMRQNKGLWCSLKHTWLYTPYGKRHMSCQTNPCEYSRHIWTQLMKTWEGPGIIPIYNSTTLLPSVRQQIYNMRAPLHKYKKFPWMSPV